MVVLLLTMFKTRNYIYGKVQIKDKANSVIETQYKSDNHLQGLNAGIATGKTRQSRKGGREHRRRIHERKVDNWTQVGHIR